MPERKPIFYDQDRRRWRRTRLALEIAGGFFTLVLIIFLVDVGRKPDLPDILRPDIHGGLHPIRGKQKPKPVRGRKRKVAALGNVPQNTIRCAPHSTSPMIRTAWPRFNCTITISTF